MDKQLTNNNEREREPGRGQQDRSAENQPAVGRHTRVENAHASGVGAMGRNDEKLPKGEDGEEQDNQDPVY